MLVTYNYLNCLSKSVTMDSLAVQKCSPPLLCAVMYHFGSGPLVSPVAGWLAGWRAAVRVGLSLQVRTQDSSAAECPEGIDHASLTQITLRVIIGIFCG